MPKVLVTGAGGFIGRAVVKQLTDTGYEAVTFDRRDGEDILDPRALDEAVKDSYAVIHLAGVLGTHELFDNVKLALAVNINGTINVLDSCVRYGSRYVGITMPQVFPSIYTATKIAATRLASAYHHTHGLPVAHVRAYNAFGPGQAHGPGHPQKILPTFAVKAWRGEPLPVWGDGRQTVDLIETRELAKVLVAALRFGDDRVFDGGTGVGESVIEVARQVCAIVGVDPLIQFLPMRRGEKPTHIVANEENWNLLNDHERPRRRPLEETVLSYKDWYDD